jgi:hypothetical protein
MQAVAAMRELTANHDGVSLMAGGLELNGADACIPD